MTPVRRAGEVERHGRVRADHALDGGMRDVALVPERHVLQAGTHGRHAHQAGKAGQVFGQHRVALVRHRRRALLALGEELLGFQHLGALQVADFGGKTLDRGGDDAQRGEEHAWRSRGITWVETGSAEPQLLATCASTRGSMLAKVPTAPEMAQVAISSRGIHAGARGSGRTRHKPGHFQAEGVGSAWMPWLRPMVTVSLCSNARRFRRPAARPCPSSRRSARDQLHVEAGVEHVRRGHALVHEAGIRPDDLGEMGQEGDDVVLGFPLDLVDAVDVEGGGAAFPRSSWRLPSGITPSSANASQAWASISNQMRNFDSGDIQIARDHRDHVGAGITPGYD
jgi:hypothetical protein